MQEIKRELFRAEEKVQHKVKSNTENEIEITSSSIKYRNVSKRCLYVSKNQNKTAIHQSRTKHKASINGKKQLSLGNTVLNEKGSGKV